MKHKFLAPLFPRGLTKDQIAGIDAIVRASSGLPISFRAYLLATAYHETGGSMQPNVENLNYTSAERIKGVWPRRFPNVAAAAPFVRNPRGLANRVYNGRMGNRQGTDDGWTFRGHGLAHITGRENFDRASRALGVDFIKHPEKTLEAAHAAEILVRGSVEGWFTGKKLGDYLPGDYRSARRVINGLDRADDIAAYAQHFERALLAAPIQPATAPATFFTKLVAAFQRLLTGGRT